MKIEKIFEIIWLVFLAIAIPSIDALVAIEFGKIVGGVYGFLFFLIAIIATIGPWIKIYKKIEKLR
ncbi:hypothetical protein HYW76_02710 [Candidatus Pacearchaeota archaeon]|nr:hypothetical protein [Candidatus Pacearchaeota archaeon]